MREKMLRLCFGLIFLFSTCFANDGDLLRAYINSKGIKGFVNFNQHNTTTVRIVVNITVTNESIAIDIYEHPTIFKDKCTEIGSKIYQLTPHNETLNGVFHESNKITLRGNNSIQGRSLVISDSSGNKLACATILSTGLNNKYAMATLSTDTIAGKVEFIQQGTGETIITGQISHSDGTTVPTFNHSIYITTDYTSEMTPKCPKTLELATIYNPSNKTGNCDENVPNTCKVGDLVGKNGHISVGINGNRRFTMTDSDLPLSGESSVLRRLLVITSYLKPKKVIGCGIIMQTGPLQANAEFKAVSSKGISGSVSFSQDSPYHNTILSVDFSGLANRAGGYHVHKFPISDVNNPCGPESVGGHWNPYNIDVKKSPPTGQGSLDQYECGDLSQKFGDFTGANSFQRHAEDNNLPMFGRDTLMGRSVVIHRSDAKGSRFVCADIVPKASTKIEGHVNFTLQDDTLNGFVSLSQYILPNGIMTQTLFVVSLNYKGNPNQKTMDHNFHVHTKPLGNDTQYGGKCKSCHGHYNPDSVSMTNYKQQCSKNFPFRCELGDSSRKFGTYNIGGGKRFYADENTPLYGKHTVLGRSVVFHAENKSAPRFACADIKPKNGNMTDFFVMEGKSSVKDNDRMNTMIDIVAKRFGWQQKKWKIAYPKLEENKECYKFSFYVLDKNPSRYSSIMEKLGKTTNSTFVPCQSESSSGIAAISSVIVTSMSLLFTYALLM